MKAKLLLVIVFSVSLLTNQFVLSQYSAPDQMKWNVDPRQTTMFDANTKISSDLPSPTSNDYKYITPPATMDYIPTPNGVVAVSPSFRLLPGASVTQSELYITRHPLNPLIMYASSNTYPVTGTISEGTYVTVNGGVTWTGMDLLGPTNQGGDPGITIDKNGVFIQTHLGFSTSGMFSNRSVNNGTTWANNVTIVAGSEDKNLAGTDDAPSSAHYGRSYVVWSNFQLGSPPIDVAFTDNGATSWSAPAQINTPPASHYSQGCDTRCGPNGEVYVVWTAPIQSGSFTEDFAGFAKSVNGGVTWTVTENAFDMNGIRGTLATKNNIRVNSFPRIDVDRSGGPRNGWIYVVVSQKNLAPAGSDADIVLHKSIDGGLTWSAGVRVNQDALNNGKIQYFPCVRVDEGGGVNIFYNDDRNVAGALMQNYMSRSVDGGVTFTDVQVTDHNYTPAPISGLATGYQGDYMGITSGNGKVWCNWMDNSSGIYQSWVASVDVNVLPAGFCEDFTNATFPPPTMHEEFTGTNYWARFAQSAYGVGVGSARFNSWTASTGVVQSIISNTFVAVGANTYVTFDEAYAPWSGGNVDSLIVQSSVDGGTTFTTLARLWGGLGAQAGPLNTVFAGGLEFIPANNQWRPKSYLLPVGTNSVKLRAVSGFGNDIWVDNFCVQPLAAPIANSIGLLSQGNFIPTDPYWRFEDTIMVYLHRTDFPNVVVDSSKGVMGPNAVCSNLMFYNALNGTYYRVVQHRNSIETWSNVGTVYARGSNNHYNFVPDGASFGNNEAIVSTVPFYRGMYSGDVNQDSIIDLTDIQLIYNDALVFTGGYVVTDLNGDFFVDLTDIQFAYNNATNFVTRVAPAGGEPSNTVSNFEDASSMTFENDAVRQKYEMTKTMLQKTELQRNDQRVQKEAQMKLREEARLKRLILNKDNEIKSPSYNNNASHSGPGER